MEVIQTDKTSQTDLSSTTPTRSNPGDGKRDGSKGGGDGLNTGIWNQGYLIVEGAARGETIPKSVRPRECVYDAR